MTWLCAARRAAARSSGLSALISICGRAHHVALSGSRGTYQISQPGNCRSSSRRRSPCPTGSLLHPRSTTRPSPARSTRRRTRCGSFRLCQSTTPRQPQLTGACSRKPTGTRQALRRDAPGASDLLLRHRRFSGTVVALVRDGVSAGSRVILAGSTPTPNAVVSAMSSSRSSIPSWPRWRRTRPGPRPHQRAGSPSSPRARAASAAACEADRQTQARGLRLHL